MADSIKKILKPLIRAQKRCIRTVYDIKWDASVSEIMKARQILSLRQIVEINSATEGYKIVHGLAPTSIQNDFVRSTNERRNLDLEISRHNSTRTRCLPSYNLPKLWNGISENQKKVKNLHSFREQLKKNFLGRA